MVLALANVVTDASNDGFVTAEQNKPTGESGAQVRTQCQVASVPCTSDCVQIARCYILAAPVSAYLLGLSIGRMCFT